MNFTQLSGPPLHANTPGVFDRTGDDLNVNGAHFGLCLGELGERKPGRARIGKVVNSEKMVVLGDGFKEAGEGIL